MRSSNRSTSAQSHFTYPPAERLYVATSGTDPVEYGHTLEWIEQRAIEIVQQTGDDLALWLVEKDEPPRIVAYVRPGLASAAVVKYV